MRQITEIDDPRLVKGLAHTLRIHILRVLQDRVASPSEIADELAAPLGNVSYHVRFLARVGLIELARTEPRRGAVEHYYRAVGKVRVADAAWAQVPQIVRDALLGSTLEQAGRLVGDAAANGGFGRPDAHASRRELTLDDEGFSQLAEALGELSERAGEIERAAGQRIAAVNGRDGEAPANGGRAVRAGLVMMLFDGGTTAD